MVDKIALKLSSSSRYNYTLSSLANEVDCIVPYRDEGFLEGLIKHRKETIVERDNLIKSLIYIVALLFIITNNREFELPVLKIKLLEFPAVVEILLIASSVTLLVAILKFKDVMFYDGFISLCLEKTYGGSQRERDVIKASKLADSLSFKIYSYPYFPGDKEVFETSFLGNFFDIFVSLLLAVFFTALFLTPVLYLAYVSYSFTSHDLIGICVAGVSQFVLFGSLILIFTGYFKFSHSYNVGDWKFEE